MTVARKLQIPHASTVVVLGCPTDVDLEIPDDCLVVSDPSDAAQAAAVVSFLVRAEDLDEGTDLNRDVLAGLVEARGVQPVRAVSVDSVWSALRFRPL